MKNIIRIYPLLVTAVIFFSICSPVLAGTKSEIYKNWRGLAIEGYDPVGYHTEGKPVKGSRNHEYEWKGARWRFADQSHLDLFKSDPEKYAPRYGGYCAWAVSQGYTASVDPENAWTIFDGKLYLNYNVEVKKEWSKDIPGNIEKANVNWPGVLT